MTATLVRIRVQALGGKFLGDDIGGAVITIRDAQTGELFASGTTVGDSGNLSSTFVPGTSLFTVATPAAKYSGNCSTGVTLQWLSPDSTSSVFEATVDLDRPRLLEISALGPVGGLQSAHRVTVTEWFVPGQSPTDLGLVLVIPGLLVQVMQPATHTTFAASTNPTTIVLQANVGMMCGCPINTSPGNPWIPSDFEVSASIHQVHAANPVSAPIPLSFTGTSSIFEGVYAFTPGTKSVFYEAVITARQLSTGNVGTGTVTFFVKPAS